jgi:hypothetical protein
MARINSKFKAICITLSILHPQLHTTMAVNVKLKLVHMAELRPEGCFALFYSIYLFSSVCYGLNTTEIYSELKKNVGLSYESLGI